MSARFFVTYALRSLARGGQRSLLAAGCIAFGVMSLVALQLLSAIVGGAIELDPRQILGGDATLSRKGSFTAEDLAELERLGRDGEIAAVSLMATGQSPLVKRSGSGRVYFANRVMSVDPATYPLVGEIALREGGALADAIAAPGAAVVTRDLVDKLGLEVGETFTLAGLAGAPPAPLVVAGVAESVPDHQGDTILYSLETARRMAGRDDVVTAASVLWGPAARPAELEARGWSMRTTEAVTRDRKRAVELFSLMLEGAGILGLLISGVGVANTMQVMLARRRTEIAILKGLGYTRAHLLALFGIEAAALGLAGGVVGAGAAVLLSHLFMTLLGRTGPILLDWTADPRIVAGGIAVGVATAVIFGMYAIARASAVRPATLLRELPTPTAWGEAILLYGALGTLFAALASVILGSVLEGVGVVAFGFVGLALLAGLLGAAFAVVVRVPVPLPSIVALARQSLKRQTRRVVVALVALFCGVFTIGFAGSTMLNAKERVERLRASEAGENLTVYTRAGEADRAVAELERAGVTVVRREERGAAVVVAGTIAPERLAEAADAVGAALPDAVVFSRRDVNDAMQRAYENLLAFVVAVAGLALVAGAVLIANVVGLAMVERRREMGILKAIGFSRARVLGTIAVEQALLGLLAGGFGVAAVMLAMATINWLRPQAELSLVPAHGVAMVAASIAIGLASALAVAWRPTRMRPLEVLREE